MAWVSRVMTSAICAIAVVTAGCGGNEAAVLGPAFERELPSANVAMTLSVSGGAIGMRATVQGPYKSNGPAEMPDLDWRIHAGGFGSKPIEARVVSTATNAWVQSDGQTYEVGADKIAAFKQRSASVSQTDMRSLLKSAEGWFSQTSTQEDADLDGEPVTRVTGRLDLAKALTGIMGLTQQKGLDVGSLRGFVADPRFTVDVAKSDGLLRRIAATMQLDGAAGGGTIAFSIRFTDVGEPVAVHPLSGGRPIEELGGMVPGLLGGRPGDAA